MDLLGLSLLLLAGLTLLLLALIAHSLWTLTHPPRRTYSWAVARNLPGDPREASPPGREVRFAEATFATRIAGRPISLPLWDIEGFDPRGPTIVITHGWGDSRITMLPRVQALLPAARRIVVWDLPGHGEAPGICRLGATELLHLQDLIAHIRATEPQPAAPSPLLLYGFSLGAGLSIAAAAAEDREAQIAGVIAEAPYRMPIEPAWNLARALHLPHRVNLPVAMALAGVLFARDWRWGGWRTSRFDRAKLAAEVQCPLLVLHGGDDPISDAASGGAIAEAAPRGRYVEIPGGRHNNLWVEPECRRLAVESVEAFLREVASMRPALNRDATVRERGCAGAPFSTAGAPQADVRSDGA